MGRTFSLRGSMPLERLLAVARLVDEQLRELQQAHPAGSLTELAILVALNLAYESLESKEEYHQLHAEIEKRSRQLIHILETHDSYSPPGP
jgi:cell division protein ZapA (FtsZ GTPase activity inhibitor)